MGYSPSLFWSLSLEEIYDLIDAFIRRQKRDAEKVEADLKTKAIMNSVLARQIGEYFSGMKPTPLHELYPNLFSEPEVDVELYREQMKDFAFRYNLKNGGEGADA